VQAGRASRVYVGSADRTQRTIVREMEENVWRREEVEDSRTSIRSSKFIRSGNVCTMKYK
jgi:hypothetical protein